MSRTTAILCSLGMLCVPQLLASDDGQVQLGASSSTEPLPGRPVSLARLLARDEALIVKRVRTIGVFFLDVETVSLCLTREDMENGVDLNCVDLAMTDEQIAKTKRLRGDYVLVEGTFRSEVLGSLPELVSITEMTHWKSGRQIRFAVARDARDAQP